MASIYDEIRAVLENTLSSVSNIPSIAWENVNFNPPNNASYIKARLVPTIRRPAVRGTNPQMYYQGYYLIEVYCPEGNGPAAADALANSIIDAFEATTDLSLGAFRLPIRYAERDLGVREGAFYKVEIRIGWYKYQ